MKVYQKAKLLVWPWVTWEPGWRDRVDFSTRWMLALPNLHKWAQEELDCGCRRNRFTHKMMLYVWKCPEHGAWSELFEDD